MGKSGDKPKKKLFWQKNRDQNGSQKKPMLNGKDNEAVPQPVDSDIFVPPDGGWGWIVCLTSLWANGTVFGIINTFGIIYVQMRDQYAREEALASDVTGNGTATESQDVSLKTAFIGSMCTGVTFFMCTISSILSDRIGIRPTAMTGAILATVGLVSSMFVEQMELLYLTYGLLLGIGSSMVYSPSLVILGHYFKERMGLVNGIVSFGSSIFTIGLTRILPFLLSRVGIKYTFLFLSGLHFLLIFFSFSWKPLLLKHENIARLTLSTESVYEHCNNCCFWTKKFLNVKIWRNKAYVIWVGSMGVALFGYFVPFFHLPKHIEDTFPSEDGSWLILCLSITSGISRIIFGKLADFECVSRIKMQQLAFAVLGISTLCIPFSASFGGLIAISLVMGVCDGIFVCLLGPIAFDIVGPGAASQAIGFLLGIFSIPFTAGPPIAGFLYDELGDYKIAFHVAGAPPILGALLMFFIPKVTQSQGIEETPEVKKQLSVDKEVVCGTNITNFANKQGVNFYCKGMCHMGPLMLSVTTGILGVIGLNLHQSFPPVTETMEFASISNTDIFSGRRVQRPLETRKGAQSGPVTELQLITSNDLLYLGGKKGAKPSIVDNDREKGVDGETKVPNDVITTVDESGSVVKNSKEVEEPEVEASESEPMLAESKNENQNRMVDEKRQESDDNQGGLGDRESKLLEEMEKYLESNRVSAEDATLNV